MTVDQKSRHQDLKRAIKALLKCHVLVGIPGDAGGGADGRPSNAVLGYIHEFGAPEHNIPARPWLLPGIAAAQDKIAATLAKGGRDAVRAAMDGNAGPRAAVAVADQALHKAGLAAVTSIQRGISAGIAPPLSPRTVYARLHRKKNRRSGPNMTPLVDTNEMFKSIRYTVET